MRAAILLGAGVLLAARALHAQAPAAPTAPAEIVPAARLRALGDSLTPAASRTAPLGRGAGYTYALTHRDSSGTLEAHMAWTDVFVVEAGAATLLSGGVAEGARETTPGEWRGGTTRGGQRAPLRPGDVVVVPAGTPHQMLLAPGERISYLAFKVAVPAPAARP